MEAPPPIRFELLIFCSGMCLCFQLTGFFSVLGKQCVSSLPSSNLKAIVWLEMKTVGLKSIKACAPKSSVRQESLPCPVGQTRRKGKLMDERAYTLSIGNGEYFWTNKDTLWNYVQTLSGKK